MKKILFIAISNALISHNTANIENSQNINFSRINEFINYFNANKTANTKLLIIDNNSDQKIIQKFLKYNKEGIIDLIRNNRRKNILQLINSGIEYFITKNFDYFTFLNDNYRMAINNSSFYLTFEGDFIDRDQDIKNMIHEQDFYNKLHYFISKKTIKKIGYMPEQAKNQKITFNQYIVKIFSNSQNNPTPADPPKAIKQKNNTKIKKFPKKKEIINNKKITNKKITIKELEFATKNGVLKCTNKQYKLSEKINGDFFSKIVFRNCVILATGKNNGTNVSIYKCTLERKNIININLMKKYLVYELLCLNINYFDGSIILFLADGYNIKLFKYDESINSWEKNYFILKHNLFKTINITAENNTIVSYNENKETTKFSINYQMYKLENIDTPPQSTKTSI